MRKGNQVVFGIYRTRDEVDMAIIALKSARFRTRDVAVLMPPKGVNDTLVHTKGSKASEGAVIGLGIGGVLGALFGWALGVGSAEAAPPLASLLAAGPILSALSVSAIVGLLGGVIGALVGYNIPEYVAERYEDYKDQRESGGMLLSVHVDDDQWMGRAKEILDETGATDISHSTEIPSAASARRRTADPGESDDISLPLR